VDKIEKMNVINELPPVITDQPVSVDIEIFGMTGRLHRPTGTFASMQIGVGDDVYVILNEMALQEAWDNIKNAPVLIMHNALFDIRHLRRWITIEERPIYDTMIMEQVLWGGYYNNGEFSLADLARRYLGIQMDKGVREDFANATYMTKDMYEYSAQDAWVTLRVYEEQQKVIEQDKRNVDVYWGLDAPSIWTILDIKPIKVDVDRWLKAVEGFQRKADELQDELGINVKSGAQVGDYIKRVSGYDLPKTNKGNYITKFDILHEHREDIGLEVYNKIIDARTYRDAVSKYGSKWIYENVEDGLVYSDFRVNGTETGRFSSAAPNLLNVPARKLPIYREFFVNSKGMMVVSDISQQEPRCLAYLSHDKNLTQAFVEGEDLHLYVTRKIYGDDTIQKDDPRRAGGKAINLGTSYGLTAYGLSKRLGISEDEAEKFLNMYFARFPDVRNYIIRQRQMANRDEYVETIMGRRVWINKYNRQWENNAINAPIQGSSADFAKLWVNKFRELCYDEGMEFPVNVVVYDEVVMDIRPEDYDTYMKLLNDAFVWAGETMMPDMPIVLDTERGHSWACKAGHEDTEDEEVEDE